MKLELSLDTTALWGRLTYVASKFNIYYFLLIYFAMHMIQITFPNNGDCSSACVFDETYVVKDANNLLQGMGTVRLPIPSIFGAIGISIFGNGAFGWRIFPAVFQVGALFFFYLISKRYLGERWGLAATMLLGLDTIFFIHGGLLLNDSTMFFFALAATEFYLRGKYWIAGGLFGFALVSREMSLFYLATLAVYHAYVNRKTVIPGLKTGGKFLLVAGIVSFSILSAYDFALHPPTNAVSVSISVFNQVIENNGTAVSTQTISSTSTSVAVITNAVQHIVYVYLNFGPGTYINAAGQYRPYKEPWAWVLPFDIVPRNGTLMQSAFVTDSYLTSFVQTSVNGVVTNSYDIHYYTYQPNLALWYGFWPAIIVGLYAFFKRKEVEAAVLTLTGILINYLPWLTLGITDPTRIGFNFYFIYTLPFIAFGEAFAFKMLPQRYGWKVMALMLFISAVFFLYYFPTRGLTSPA